MAFRAKCIYIRAIISAEVNSVKFQASVPWDTMRALRGVCWPPLAFEDKKEVAARPRRRPYIQLTGHVVN